MNKDIMSLHGYGGKMKLNSTTDATYKAGEVIAKGDPISLIGSKVYKATTKSLKCTGNVIMSADYKIYPNDGTRVYKVSDTILLNIYIEYTANTNTSRLKAILVDTTTFNVINSKYISSAAINNGNFCVTPLNYGKYIIAYNTTNGGPLTLAIISVDTSTILVGSEYVANSILLSTSPLMKFTFFNNNVGCVFFIRNDSTTCALPINTSGLSISLGNLCVLSGFDTYSFNYLTACNIDTNRVVVFGMISASNNTTVSNILNYDGSSIITQYPFSTSINGYKPTIVYKLSANNFVLVSCGIYPSATNFYTMTATSGSSPTVIVSIPKSIPMQTIPKDSYITDQNEIMLLETKSYFLTYIYTLNDSFQITNVLAVTSTTTDSVSNFIKIRDIWLACARDSNSYNLTYIIFNSMLNLSGIAKNNAAIDADVKVYKY